MSIYVQPGLHVRIEELQGENAPRPLPLSSGFDEEKEYEILGIHIPSETAEAYLLLKNDRDEIWFISNRHVQIVDGGKSQTYAKATGIVHLNGRQK